MRAKFCSWFKPASMSVQIACGVAMLCVSALMGGAAVAEIPSAKLVAAPAVSPSQAWTFYGSSNTTTTGVAARSNAAPEIVALARSLGADRIGPAPGQMTQAQFVQNVFEYVRSNIATEFRFGLGKGGYGALIDESGTPFDQAQLMQRLLAQGGQSADYKLGVITLTASEFGRWSGFVKNLDQQSQSFSVDARAACQFLADGGIPAVVNGSSNCASLTGDLATVSLGHIWLQSGGVVFDPSFKQHDLKAGLNLSAAMQCGAATCASTATAAAMTGAASGTVAGSSTLTNVNSTALDTLLSTYATRLQTVIEAGDANARVEDVVGGKVLSASQPGYGTSPSVQLTWSEIPDQFRTTLRVQVDSIDVMMFADEISGRRLGVETVIDGTGNGNHAVALSIEAMPLAQGPRGSTPLILTVDPPYAAVNGSYGNATYEFESLENGSTALVLALGDATAARARHYGGLAEGSPNAVGTGWTSIAQFSAQESQARTLVAATHKAALTQHYSVGLAGNGFDLATGISANATSGDVENRLSTYRTLALISGMLEGSVLEQAQGTTPVMSTAAGFEAANSNGSTFIDIAPADYAAAVSQLQWSSLANYERHANAGARLIAISSAPSRFVSYTNGLYEYIFTGHFAYTAETQGYWAGMRKGGAAPLAPNPGKAALDSINQSAVSLRAALTADSGNGVVNLAPPADLVTGFGPDPEALSLKRYYSSATKFLPRDDTPGELVRYSGPDADVLGRIGGGWIHNYQISARLKSDGLAGLGSERGVDAAAAIAGIAVLSSQQSAPAFQDRLTSIFVASWMGRKFIDNSVTVHLPPRSETFVRRANGQFGAPPGTSTRLAQNGTRSLPIGLTRHPMFNDRVSSLGFSYDNITLVYTGAEGEQVTFEPSRFTDYHLASLSDPVFSATSMVYPNSMRVDFTYQPVTVVSQLLGDGVGRSGYQLIRVQNSWGRSLSFTHNHLTLTRVTDENGRYVQYALNCSSVYLACGSLSVTSPGGKTSRFEYAHDFSWDGDQITRPTYRMTRWFTPAYPNTPFLEFGWDRAYRLATVTDALQRQTKYYAGSLSGGERFKRSEEVDPLGANTVRIFDENNNLTRQTDPLNRTTTHAYDSAGRLVRSVYPEGNAQELSYDLRSNVIRTCTIGKLRAGQACNPTLGDFSVTTTYSEPSLVVCANPATCNKPTSITDARGATTNYAWTPYGGLERIERPADPAGVRPLTQFVYTRTTAQANVRLLTSRIDWTSPTTSTTTKYAYATANKLVPLSVVVDLGGLALPAYFGFDAIGNMTSYNGLRGGAGDTTEYVWDDDRRLLLTVGPSGANTLKSATLNTYDDDGLLTTVQKGTATGASTTLFAPQMRTNFTFDPMGNKVRESLYDVATNTPLQVKQMAYDGVDRVTCTAVRMNASTMLAPPADACAAGTPGADGADRISRNTYDLAGQLTSVEQGVGTPEARFYARYTYTPNGKRKTITDAVGNLTTLEYGGFDFLRKQIFPSQTRGAGTSNAADFEEYAYDANGNRISVRKRNGQTILYTFDALNRVRFKDIPGSSATDVTYTYDLLDRLLSASYPAAGASVAYSYDGAGRKTSETTYGRQLTSEFDGAGNRTRLTWPDGSYVNYAYDNAYRVNSMTQDAGTAVASFRYDGLGRRTRIDRPNSTATTSSYDGAGRLLELHHLMTAGGQPGADEVVTYNAASQVATATRNEPFVWRGPAPAADDTHDGLNRLSRLLAMPTSAYDANGNLTYDGVRTFTYDVENRMIGVTAGPMTTSEVYDPIGRIYSRTVSGGGVTYFLHDGDRMVGEYDTPTATSALRRFVHGPGVDEPMVMYQGTTPFWLHADRQGSVIAWSNSIGYVVNAATGANRTLAYSPYGEPNSWTMPRFGFTGQAAWSELELYYYKARLYSPALGRFLQTDPVGSDDDLNLYAYVRGDPVNTIDPNGTESYRREWHDPDRLNEQGKIDGSRLRGSPQTATTQMQRVNGVLTNVGTMRDVQRTAVAGAMKAAGSDAKAIAGTGKALGAIGLPLTIGGEAAKAADQINSGKSPAQATASAAGRAGTTIAAGELAGGIGGTLLVLGGASPAGAAVGAIGIGAFAAWGADKTGATNVGGDILGGATGYWESNPDAYKVTPMY